MVRGGRDVAAALLDAPFGASSVMWAALYWQSSVRSAQTTGRALEVSRYQEISYERLPDEPEGTLRAAAEFTGLQYEPGMLRYREDKGRLD